MYPRVTAIVVARNGAAHLQRTLDALKAQTRQPDVVITIDCASGDDTAKILAEFGPTHFLSAQEKLPFGTAVATAVRVTAPPTSDDEWLWLLAQDTAPEPGALEALLGAVEVSPSVAAAGPKLVDWDDASLIRSLGEAMTPFGASVPLVEDELDQAQHDGLSDVLGVAPAGIIVRHTLWEKLGGFDPRLPSVDDSLDFCIRVRLAGYRVVLVPTAHVATAGDGIAGPSRSRRGSNRRRLARERRAAQLHRRMVYSPAAALPIHWLTLVPLAIVRSVGRLIRKEPGAIGGELAAAFGTAFDGTGTGAARRALARNKAVGWAAIAPLRVPLAEVRRARALKREASLVHVRGERRELNFFSGGGAWTVVGAAVVGVALFSPLLGASAVSGGGLLSLSDTVGQLWQNVGYGWRDIGLGFEGAADPFATVLAILGSLTFWQPSFALVLLYLAALPLAALGAWFAATKLTERSGLRAFAAIAWTIAPPFLVSMQSGQPAAILVHLLLPWLFFAGLSVRRSLAASATTSLLAAAVLACAPSLAPAFFLIWLIALILNGRRFLRLIAIPIPTLALFAPLIWQQGMRGNWLAIFADPGLPQAVDTGHAWQLAVGFPDRALGGWYAIAESFGLPGAAPSLIVPILLAPIGILALLALFLRGSTRAILALGLALLGFLTAVAAEQVVVVTSASSAVPVWPGTALSLYWLGLIAAATLGLGAIGRFAALPAWAALIILGLAVAPAAAALQLGRSSVTASDGQTLPAVVTAQAQTQPRVGTLLLTPQPDGGLGAQLIRGMGTTLDEQSTLSATATSLSTADRTLATTAGNLASQSGMDASAELSRLGVGFVLLAEPAQAAGQGVTPEAAATQTRASTALDGNAILAPVATTQYGVLWSYRSGDSAVSKTAEMPASSGAIRSFVLIVQAIVIGITLLLSIPTGRASYRNEPSRRRPEREADETVESEERLEAEDAEVPEGSREPESVPEGGGVTEPEDPNEVPADSDAIPEPGENPMSAVAAESGEVQAAGDVATPDRPAAVESALSGEERHVD